MIITTISDDGLYRINKSDSNKYIQKEGTDEIYIEAWDITEFEYVYIETDIEIEPYRRPMMMSPVVSNGTITPYNTSAFGTTINTNNYYSSVAVLDFNGNVNQIGTDAYKDKTNLYSIAIPDTVTSIGPTAFSGCTNCCVYDFGCSRTTIPTLQDANSLLLKTQYYIVIPDTLYSTWSTRTNWSRLSKSVFIRHSDFMELEKNEPLKFTATQLSTIGFTYNTEGPAIILYKSTDKVNWERWDFTDITLNTGDSIYIKGHNLSGFANIETTVSGFTITGGVNCTGNIMSLLDEYSKDIITDYAFCKVFQNCTGLITPPELPATVLGVAWSYGYMFAGCTSLITAPELPSTTMTTCCYYNMFNGCTSLTTPPILPATTLQAYCYSSMFYSCTALTSAPNLPVTNLANNCYANMFYNCTSLVNIPSVLPATTLQNNCYYQMFRGCTAITTAPQILATTLGNYSCYCMFFGCTSLTTAPDLLSQELKQQCYYDMFYNCPNINHITCLATSGFDTTNCLTNWLYGTSTNGTFTKTAGVEWPRGISGIPNLWVINNYFNDPEVIDIDA